MESALRCHRHRLQGLPRNQWLRGIRGTDLFDRSDIVYRYRRTRRNQVRLLRDQPRLIRRGKLAFEHDHSVNTLDKIEIEAQAPLGDGRRFY